MIEKRGRGRPPLAAGESESARIEIRVRPTMLDAMRKAAERQGMPVGTWLKRAAERALVEER
jgi:predicted DNA binding CopG/RHH family protein